MSVIRIPGTDKKILDFDAENRKCDFDSADIPFKAVSLCTSAHLGVKGILRSSSFSPVPSPCSCASMTYTGTSPVCKNGAR